MKVLTRVRCPNCGCEFSVEFDMQDICKRVILDCDIDGQEHCGKPFAVVILLKPVVTTFQLIEPVTEPEKVTA